MAALSEEDLCLVANEEESEGKEIVSVSDKGGFGSRHIGVLKPLPLLSPVKQNVDLNLAPPNWLRGSGAGRYFHKPLFSQFNKTSDRNTSHINPSSIILASHYSHLVGGVIDVIADTKSVKKLLTMPYNKSNVSMSVHRIGRTLLIDELYTDTSLRGFEKLSSVGELPKVPLVKKDPVSVRHRSMYSKLLYYSTPDDEDEDEHIPILPAPEHLLTLPDPVKGAGPDIDELSDVFPCVPPDPLPQPFHLNVEWTVNDIRMLLGSDLPIFGKEGKPAISLKLRDMDKPITVLTGLDYWLDNLMCNVPEVAMCYHVDGIVQKFDVMKTEDIPKLDKNCQFSPQEVLKVAENILSFLKGNCTKEGHTYWLFRPKGEDLVKLYDLTSLTSDNKETEAIENPFAKSVAMLFYRVSQRMLQYGACDNKKELNNIKILLENCIKLLHNDLNSQIVMSSYYLLAGMFLSHTPSLEEESCNSDDDDESQLITNDEPYISSLAVSSLIQNIDPSVTTPPPVSSGSIDLSVTNSLKICLTYVSKALEGMDPLGIVDNWRVSGSSQLLQTAGNAYWKLAEGAMTDNELGQCLRWGRLAILCIKVSLALSKDKKQIKLMKNMLWSSWQLCGDVHVLCTKASSSLNRYINDFNMFDPIDCKIKTFLSSLYNPSVEEDNSLQLHVDIETSLKMSIECYNVCKSVGGASTNNKLKERLGNAWNELGVYYKHTAAAGTGQDYSEKTSLCDKSYKCINKGLVLFKETGSVPNQALLHANLGSLDRLLAVIIYQRQVEEREEKEFSSEERRHYNRSIEYYNKGKGILKRPSAHPTIWLSIEVDLSHVYYEFGRALQDRPPLSKISIHEVERDIVSLYMKAIHFAESVVGSVPAGSNHYVNVSWIIGASHQQLGSLFHKVAFDPAFSTQRQRTARTQSERHYSKSINSFTVHVNDHSLQLLRVYLERSLLFEQHANISSGSQSIKLLHQSLDDILLTVNPLSALLRDSSNDATTSTRTVSGSLKQLLAIVVQRLRTIFKQLLALSIKKTTSVQDDNISCTISQYKRLYVLSISDIDIDTDLNTDSDINTDLLLSDVIKLLENIKVILS